jgi:hypothetical protein
MGELPGWTVTTTMAPFERFGLSPRIAPNRCPNGVLLRVVTDTGRIVVEQTVDMLADDDVLELLADEGAAATDRLGDDVTSFVLAGYDGDDGRLMMAAIFERTDD